MVFVFLMVLLGSPPTVWIGWIGTPSLTTKPIQANRIRGQLMCRALGNFRMKPSQRDLKGNPKFACLDDECGFVEGIPQKLAARKASAHEFVRGRCGKQSGRRSHGCSSRAIPGAGLHDQKPTPPIQPKHIGSLGSDGQEMTLGGFQPGFMTPDVWHLL